MHDRPREPSRLPVRGTFAALGTVGALALLLSFRGGPLAPTDPVTAAAVEPGAVEELLPVDPTDSSTGAAIVAPVSITGQRIATRWGDVQVAVTLEGDDIVDVQTLAVPMRDRRSQRINAYAEPILREEAIAIDSADVSVVSGATYTSLGYAASLQSALDQLSA